MGSVVSVYIAFCHQNLLRYAAPYMENGFNIPFMREIT